MKLSEQNYPFSSTKLEGGGKIPVGTTPVKINFSTLKARSVIISSDMGNTGYLYIGNGNILSDGSNAALFLTPGDVVTLDYDPTINPLYIVASVAGQNFWNGGLN